MFLRTSRSGDHCTGSPGDLDPVGQLPISKEEAQRRPDCLQRIGTLSLVQLQLQVLRRQLVGTLIDQGKVFEVIGVTGPVGKLEDMLLVDRSGFVRVDLAG